jgi:hypothetical protein
MRTSTICTLILVALCFLATPQQADARITITDTLRYDDSTNVVYGYASTFLSYPESYYYDAGVDSVLYDQYGNVRDYNSYLGGSLASVNTQTFGTAGLSFYLNSGHYLGFYYYYCDYYECGYYDYYGYSFYGGEYPSYYEFQPYYYCYVFYDVYEFAETFLGITVPEPQCPSGTYVQLQSDRVGGVLNGTTQTALLGANVNLRAVVTGASSGTYTWTVTGVAQQNASGSTDTIYWRDVGMKTVRVDFTPSGSNCRVSATVNVNVILPTLNSFTGIQDAADTLIKVTPDNLCGPILGVRFGLGCMPPDPVMYQPGSGINFVAQASVPQGLLSDPAQSLIKFVQITSSLRQRQVMGQSGYDCKSSLERNPPWMLDTSDPYDQTRGQEKGYVDFATANPATIKTGDNPGEYVDTAGYFPSFNYFYVNESFEMYVVYFTSNDPTIQIPLSRIRWRWGGEVVYDPTAPTGYRLNYGYSTLGAHPSEPVSAFTPYSGNAHDLQYVPCNSGGGQCDPTGSMQQACFRRGWRYEWDPDACQCIYTGGL